MLASNLDNSTEKPLQNNIGREKDIYQSGVIQVDPDCSLGRSLFTDKYPLYYNRPTDN